MKKVLSILILTLIVSSVCAQKKKAPTVPTITLEEALHNYDFSIAEQLLRSEMAQLQKKKQSVTHLEEQLQQVQMASRMLSATERVTFVDSMVVDRTTLLSQLHFSSENGDIHTYADFFHTVDTMDCMVFQSQMGDKIYFSKMSADGNIHLYTSDLIGERWTEPELLRGVSDNDDSQNYPFMMSDGATLYFAAMGEESLGGYDIFMTRYDADEHCFLAPENIGMPFNSPANDYLFVIDEYYNLGWFVTDRNQPEDKVCLYVFIPNETRVVYEDVEDAQLQNLARISSICDTWSDQGAVSQALTRLEESKGQQKASSHHDFTFVVDDTHIYYNVEDFRNAQARQQALWWKEGKADLLSSTKRLEEMRAAYHAANANERQQMTTDILTLEAKVETLRQTLNKQEKDIRRLELGR